MDNIYLQHSLTLIQEDIQTAYLGSSYLFLLLSASSASQNWHHFCDIQKSSKTTIYILGGGGWRASLFYHSNSREDRRNIWDGEGLCWQV